MRCWRELCSGFPFGGVKFGAAAGQFFGREPGRVGIVVFPAVVAGFPLPAVKRCVVRGRATMSSALSASPRVKCWLSSSNGLPAALPSGKSENTKRGTPQCSTMSFAQPMMTVAMPAASRCRAAQRQGLVAHRAIGNQHGCLGSFIGQRLEQGRRVLFGVGALRPVGWEPVNPAGEGSYAPGAFSLLQGFERKPCARVASRCVGAVIGDVGKCVHRVRGWSGRDHMS